MPATKFSNLTIILADDHELIREAVKPYLRRLAEDVQILEASNYEEVCAIGKHCRATAQSVDLALIDLDMPGYDDANPFKKITDVKNALHQSPLVIFSASDDRSTIAAALNNGARGFVPKSMRGQSLVNALRMVLWGEIYVPPNMAIGVPPETRQSSEHAIQNEADVENKLSPREADSLRFLVRGMTNKEIGREMGLQEVTVKMHLRNAYRKIGATNRIEAVRIALESGIT
ncbi:MAG: LuxR C-terminal-related transcriptional regulator [Rhodospirillaceae bacterium]